MWHDFTQSQIRRGLGKFSPRTEVIKAIDYFILKVFFALYEILGLSKILDTSYCLMGLTSLKLMPDRLLIRPGRKICSYAGFNLDRFY